MEERCVPCAGSLPRQSEAPDTSGTSASARGPRDGDDARPGLDRRPGCDEDGRVHHPRSGGDRRRRGDRAQCCDSAVRDDRATCRRHFGTHDRGRSGGGNGCKEMVRPDQPEKPRHTTCIIDASRVARSPCRTTPARETEESCKPPAIPAPGRDRNAPPGRSGERDVADALARPCGGRSPKRSSGRATPSLSILQFESSAAGSSMTFEY